MKIDNKYQVRDMAGEHVIVMPGRFGVDMTRVISLNESSLLLWNALQDKEFTAEDAADILVGNYGIDPQTALRDARTWCDKLLASGVAR